MERHVVIGTAGHIDHGKTALVKALTGTDTDRWEEEKRRGITIDLGFASFELDSEVSASVVDVPGHEDFVRNMVAGATGIDLALLVIAADEGIMPQTLEHLAILEFLGIRVGVVALTKCDLVEADWLDLVESDVSDRLASSCVRWTNTIRTSVVTGQGMGELRRSLAVAAADVGVRSGDDLFRLPIDRVFSVAGAGTVVTGTTWSGSVRVGEDVLLLPGRYKARIRGIEVHGESVGAALPGRRTALALVGVGRDSVARGHVVVADGGWRETSAIDVRVTLLPRARPLTQKSRVRLHLGTAEVLARATPADQDIMPGAEGFARLRLEGPLACRWGDRGVIRSFSPVTTIGGCVVGDPWPPRRPRRPVDAQSKAAADPSLRLNAFLQRAGTRGIAPADLPVRLGISPRELPRLIEESAGVVLAVNRLMPISALSAARDRILGMVREYHEDRPLEPGMPRDLIRQALQDEELADHVMSLLAGEGRLAIEGRTARFSEFEPSLSADESSTGRRVLAEFEAAGPHGLSWLELEGILGASVSRDLLEFYVRQGTVIRVAKDRYYDRAALDRLLLSILMAVRDSEATPAQLRERTGLTRKYLIPVLEWMDGRGLTRREADVRRLGPAAEAMLKTVDSG